VLQGRAVFAQVVDAVTRASRKSSITNEHNSGGDHFAKAGGQRPYLECTREAVPGRPGLVCSLLTPRHDGWPAKPRLGSGLPDHLTGQQRAAGGAAQTRTGLPPGFCLCRGRPSVSRTRAPPLAHISRCRGRAHVDIRPLESGPNALPAAFAEVSHGYLVADRARFHALRPAPTSSCPAKGDAVSSTRIAARPGENVPAHPAMPTCCSFVGLRTQHGIGGPSPEPGSCIRTSCHWGARACSTAPRWIAWWPPAPKAMPSPPTWTAIRPLG